MADSGAQILRDMGFNWLECLDEQGVFYFNQVTQQSSDTLPQELMTGAPTVSVAAPPMPVAAPTMSYGGQATMSYGGQKPVMKAKVIGGGIEGLPQVSSYAPQVQQYQTQGSYLPQGQPFQTQTSYLPQAQQQQVASYAPLLQQAQPQVVSYTPGFQQAGMQPNSYVPLQNSYAPTQQVITAAPQMVQQVSQPATQKMAFGDWAVYEDELGTFYMQVSTGQQFESPPQELNQAYQQYRAQQDQIHMQQLQQIELQKQMIDQQVLQQTASLQAVYGVNGGPGMASLPQGYRVA